MLKLSKMHLKSELFSEVKLKEGEMNFLKGEVLCDLAFHL